MGTSISPVLFTLPVSAKTFVPLVSAVPILLNQSAPLEIITGIFASVSTLLITVGLSQRPFTAGKGGRGRGMPLLPSIEASKAVSSPHTKAPAPSLNSISKSKSLFSIFSPSSPYSRAASIAVSSRLIASGYSARI